MDKEPIDLRNISVRETFILIWWCISNHKKIKKFMTYVESGISTRAAIRNCRNNK